MRSGAKKKEPLPKDVLRFARFQKTGSPGPHAVTAIAERVRGAKSVVASPAFTLSRFRLQKEARKAIEALGCPFATTSMEKCIIDESHPSICRGVCGSGVRREDAADCRGCRLGA